MEVKSDLRISVKDIVSNKRARFKTIVPKLPLSVTCKTGLYGAVTGPLLDFPFWPKTEHSFETCPNRKNDFEQ